MQHVAPAFQLYAKQVVQHIPAGIQGWGFCCFVNCVPTQGGPSAARLTGTAGLVRAGYSGHLEQGHARADDASADQL